jgi:hypothetical protein
MASTAIPERPAPWLRRFNSARLALYRVTPIHSPNLDFVLVASSMASTALTEVFLPSFLLANTLAMALTPAVLSQLKQIARWRIKMVTKKRKRKIKYGKVDLLNQDSCKPENLWVAVELQINGTVYDKLRKEASNMKMTVKEYAGALLTVKALFESSQ